MNPDGSKRTVLTTGKAFESDPVLSPDGRRVAFTDVTPGRDQYTNLGVMNADGSRRTKLTNHAADTYVCGVSWSHDGKKIAFGRGCEATREQPDEAEIVVTDVDGKNSTVIGKGVAPAWSPDGKKILYTTQFDLPKGKKPHLAVMDADGKNVKALTATPALLGAWSPDGKKIA